MKKLMTTLALFFVVTLSVSAQYSTKSYQSLQPTKAYNDFVNENVWNRSNTNSDVIYQESYRRSDGTQVQGHYKTNRNETNHDNMSTIGNYNIYTGEYGTKARDYTPGASNYGSGQTIYTGERGGQYYINSNGNKTYVPKRGY